MRPNVSCVKVMNKFRSLHVTGFFPPFKASHNCWSLNPCFSSDEFTVEQAVWESASGCVYITYTVWSRDFFWMWFQYSDHETFWSTFTPVFIVAHLWLHFNTKHKLRAFFLGWCLHIFIPPCLFLPLIVYPLHQIYSLLKSEIFAASAIPVC